MTKEIINVGLYGGKGIFGGRETPLEASVISCDKHEGCSYFQNGQCRCVRQAFSSGCKFGFVQNVKGFTHRAKQYGSFKRKWQEHERYNKLKHPPTKLGLIEEVVVFPYPHVRIEKALSEGFLLKDPSFSNGVAYIPYDQFTTELIYRICTFKPQAIMGGTIKSYQKETVPLFLSHLEEVLPERYREFIEKYEGFAEKIDYVGRKAYLKTIQPSTVHYKSENYSSLNEEWKWDGEFLTYQKGHVSSFNVTDHYEIAEIRIKPSDKSIVRITNNEQVTKQTVFID